MEGVEVVVSVRGKYQREGRSNSKEKIALCNCKLPVSYNYAGYHETLEVDGVCSFCEHYVFWGTKEDMTKELKSVRSNHIRTRGNDKYPMEYKEQVRDKYENTTHRVDDICKMFNLPRCTIMAWKKKYGWKARRR